MRYILLLSSLCILYSCSTKQEKQVAPVEQASAYVLSHIDSLKALTATFETALAERKYSSLQPLFLQMRLHYKNIEPITEFYFPGISKTVNGPALDKVEEGDDKIIEATGFQVLEEMIFPLDTTVLGEIYSHTKLLASSWTRLGSMTEGTSFTNENIFEALRLSMLRMMSLGISGFDSPVAQLSLQEAHATLDGIQTIVSFYQHKLNSDQQAVIDLLLQRLYAAKTYLAKHPEFNTFNRAEFIRIACNPITESLYAYQQALSIGNNKWITAVNMESKTFFEPTLFDIRYFSPSYHQQSTRYEQELGKILFFDPLLSGNNSRSCASCHKPQRGFADEHAKSVAFNFAGQVSRNAPTLINAAYQQSQFWDGRVTYIEDQITDVLSNPHEMHGNLDKAANTLNQSDEYRQLFKNAFPDEDGITPMNIQKALSSYIRTLNSFNSDFDRYMNGVDNTMSEEALRGFNIFMGKAKCATCHFLPLFNGAVPPFYKESESEVLGTPSKPVFVNASIDTDRGKFTRLNHPLHDNMFKTPTVRNVALTAPYMHNGVFQTLEEVIDFYNRGGGAGIGIQLENQTLPPDPLDLTAQEQKDLVSFLHSLTDTTAITSTPNRLPTFKDERLNKRRIGGSY